MTFSEGTKILEFILVSGHICLLSLCFPFLTCWCGWLTPHSPTSDVPNIHYNHVTFTPIAKNFMLYCRVIYTVSILCVRLTIKVKVGIPDSLKVGWYLPKKTGSSHLNNVWNLNSISMLSRILREEKLSFAYETDIFRV